MAQYTLTVNGEERTVEAEAESPLLYALRYQLQLNGPKFGCGLAQCGACTVLLDGGAIRSCRTPIGEVADREITTVEGLADGDGPGVVQQAFIDEQAAQCGFCMSGVILTAKALLDRNPRATDAEVQQELSGVLCRCFVNIRFMKAIRKYADGRRA